MEFACETGMSNWFTKFNYPIIFWEPSFQYSVEYALDLWTNPKCEKPEGYS